jgi:hypothetical protein
MSPRWMLKTFRALKSWRRHARITQWSLEKKVHETLCLFESLYFKNHFLYTHFETFFSHFCNFSRPSKNSCLVGKFASRQKRDMRAQSVRNLTCSVNCLPKAGEVFIATDWLASLYFGSGHENGSESGNESWERLRLKMLEYKLQGQILNLGSNQLQNLMRTGSLVGKAPYRISEVLGSIPSRFIIFSAHKGDPRSQNLRIPTW